MNCEILCVGTELLLGDIVNTNAAFLSRQLAALGIGVYHQSVVGDNPGRLREEIRRLLARTDLLILTGGLGPTGDDLTKETAAEALGLPLVQNEKALERMTRYFARTGCPMPENNLKQAMVIEGAAVFQNDNGTAPGMAVEKDGKIVMLLPGPPREMTAMFLKDGLPYLERFSRQTIRSHVIHVFGQGESATELQLKHLMESENPTLSPYAKTGEVQLRLTARGQNEAECEALMAPVLRQVEEILGDKIYGVDVGTLEQAAVSLLRKKGLTVAVAESCTGGTVAKRLTDIPGASQVLGYGAVTYSWQAKEKLLGVRHETLQAHGAVSAETALQMARGIRALAGSDIGVSTTGEAGPESGEDKPVGCVFVGVSTRAGEQVIPLSLGRGGRDDRDLIRYTAASHAIHQIILAARRL